MKASEALARSKNARLEATLRAQQQREKELDELREAEKETLRKVYLRIESATSKGLEKVSVCFMRPQEANSGDIGASNETLKNVIRLLESDEFDVRIISNYIESCTIMISWEEEYLP